MVDKAEIVKIRKSTISHVSTSLKKLENKGLVEKIQSKDNKSPTTLSHFLLNKVLMNLLYPPTSVNCHQDIILHIPKAHPQPMK